MLAQHGEPALLQIGVAKNEAGALQAHAWLESQGRIVIGNSREVFRYTRLPSIEREAPVSAIVGLYNIDGMPINRFSVKRMLDSLAHRGSNGVGLWSEGSIALGHRMLWTTPESLHEKQPFWNQSGDLAITADARIDNREELIAALDLT